MIPQTGKFYYINYEDKDEPSGSYFGPARCVAVYKQDKDGQPIPEPLYEFEHPDEHESLVLSLFYANEVVIEISKP